MVHARHIEYCEKSNFKNHGRGGDKKEENEVEEEMDLILAEKTFSSTS